MKENSVTTIQKTFGLMLNSDQDASGGMSLRKNDDRLQPRRESEVRPPGEFIRPVRISSVPGKTVDKKTVRFTLYNSFNYSLFVPDDNRAINLSLGITSPNEGEGKTTAVCNLAMAISTGLGRRTLVMDLNHNNPRVHEIFGVPRSPGVTEALSGSEIFVSPTQVEHLFVMPAGATSALATVKSSMFRGLLSSLFREFEFVLLDMPSVSARNFPTLIANQLTGLIVVVKPKKTKRRDIDRLFRRVREETVLAFVMNQVDENDF